MDPIQKQAVNTQDTPKDTTGVCDSCNQEKELFDVEHAQSGNDHIWHYCATCKAAHEKNVKEQWFLQELMRTHPNDVDNPETLKIFHDNNNDIEAVKRHLDQNRQPALEAEVVK